LRLELVCKPVFARHESFHPRYGWLKKAYDGAAQNSNIFNEDEAVVQLGVGKNMVRSLRFWGLAFKILADEPQAKSRTHFTVPTKFGHVLLDDAGWDPYCELPGTLWLLHWSLFKPPSVTPVWWLAFNEFSGVEFTAEEMEQFIYERTRDWKFIHGSAVKKDVLCFLRMYASGESSRAAFEDSIDCPFRELNLIRSSPSSPGSFRFLIGPKPSLPAAVAAFSCLDFVARADSSSRIVSVNSLVTEHGSPGRAFKLTESELTELLQKAAHRSDQIELTSAAGVVQLAFDGEPGMVATELLRSHYRGLVGSTRSSFDQRIAGDTADQPFNEGTTRELVKQR
jgi:hypothetical protein